MRSTRQAARSAPLTSSAEVTPAPQPRTTRDRHIARAREKGLLRSAGVMKVEVHPTENADPEKLKGQIDELRGRGASVSIHTPHNPLVGHPEVLSAIVDDTTVTMTIAKDAETNPLKAVGLELAKAHGSPAKDVRFVEVG